jgi:hypothetical protein
LNPDPLPLDSDDPITRLKELGQPAATIQIRRRPSTLPRQRLDSPYFAQNL